MADESSCCHVLVGVSPAELPGLSNVIVHAL